MAGTRRELIEGKPAVTVIDIQDVVHRGRPEPAGCRRRGDTDRLDSISLGRTAGIDPSQITIE